MYTHLVCVLPDGDIRAFQDDLVSDEVIATVKASERVIASESDGTVSCIKGGEADDTLRFVKALADGRVVSGYTDVFGKWPGEETDEEIFVLLEETS